MNVTGSKACERRSCYSLFVELVLYFRPVVLIHPIVSNIRDSVTRWTVNPVWLVEVNSIAGEGGLQDCFRDKVWINIDLERRWRFAKNSFPIMRGNRLGDKQESNEGSS